MHEAKYQTLNVQQIYEGSDGEATKKLYAELWKRGPAGVIGVNLFRACKCSERAKKYRGGIRGKGSYRAMAYGRKHWSMGNLCQALGEFAERLGIAWGWKVDPAQEYHCWVLYIDLPAKMGQCSFHDSTRGAGPDYPGEWDMEIGATAKRIVRYCEVVLAGQFNA